MGILHIIGKSIRLVCLFSFRDICGGIWYKGRINMDYKWNYGSKELWMHIQLFIDDDWRCEIILLSLRHNYSHVIALIDHEQVI